MHLRYGSNKIDIDDAASNEAAALPIPVLGTNANEPLPLNQATLTKQGSFEVWRDHAFVFGIAHTSIDEGLIDHSAKALYDELFELTKDEYLYRIWNYIPKLNLGNGDQERYRQFSLGRSSSFRERFGNKDVASMPAGTCVGIEGNEMAVCFLSGVNRPDHHENPNQVPAYRYPRQYGPKSPSFARATSVAVSDSHYRFISGTAAVTGHQSMGIGNLEQQIAITCDNLKLIAHQTLENSPFKKEEETLDACKVYLRNPSDFKTAQSLLKQRFPNHEERFLYLQSDICRKELLIEIELCYRDPVRQVHAL